MSAYTCATLQIGPSSVILLMSQAVLKFENDDAYFYSFMMFLHVYTCTCTSRAYFLGQKIQELIIKSALYVDINYTNVQSLGRKGVGMPFPLKKALCTPMIANDWPRSCSFKFTWTDQNAIVHHGYSFEWVIMMARDLIPWNSHHWLAKRTLHSQTLQGIIIVNKLTELANQAIICRKVFYSDLETEDFNSLTKSLGVWVWTK